MIGSRGSRCSLIGLAADECCPLYLISMYTCATYCFLPWLLYHYCQQQQLCTISDGQHLPTRTSPYTAGRKSGVFQWNLQGRYRAA
jgi:hypothetical protein